MDDSWVDCNKYWLSRHIQGSREWHTIRNSYITASKVAYVIGESKFKTQHQYAYEWITKAKEKFNTESLKRMSLGIDNEYKLRDAYIALTGLSVVEVGLAVNKEDTILACSPDGVVGDDGLVEFKYTANMPPLLRYNALEYSKLKVPIISHDHIYKEYYCQMQQQMFVMGRKWCDFMVYAYNTKEVYIERVMFDSTFWTTCYAAITDFLERIVPEVKKNLEMYTMEFKDMYY